MKKTVRILALVIAVMLILSCFAGCKKNNTAEESSSTEIEYVYEYVDDEAQDADGESDDENGDASNKGNKTSKNSKSSKSKKNSKTSGSSTKNTEVRDLKGRTITFMTIWAEPEKGYSNFWNNYWKTKTQVQKDFNCKFKHVYGTGDWYDKWVASIMAGSPSADVVCCKEDPYSSIKSGLFYDVSKLKSFDFKEEKWQRMVQDMGLVNNKQYVFGAAKYQPTNIVLYNKDVLKKNGIEDLYTLQKKGKLTLDSFIEIARNLKQKTGKPSLVASVNVFNVHKWFAWAYGGKFMDRKANTIELSATINSTAVKSGFEKAQKLVDEGVIETNMDNSNWLWAREQFQKGVYPIIISGDLESALKSSNFDVGACLMPTTSGKKCYITDSMQWCAMPYNVKDPEAVASVFDRLANYIFIVDYKSRYQDIATDDVMELINTEVKAQEKGSLQLDYSAIFANDLWNNGTGNALRSMTTGEATPAQTLETVEGLFKSQITNKFSK